jgi:hypothetical protein
MKIMHWIAFATGIVLILARGFWSDLFVVDVFSVVILFILIIPFVAQYLRKAKFPGAEFEFRDEIRETEKLVKLSVDKAKELEGTGEKRVLTFETFSLSNVRGMLDSDPVLALAALRIEIERKIRTIIGTLNLPLRNESSISRLIGDIQKHELLTLEQVNALQKIVNMCNKAIHGSIISEEEARRIINLADELNHSFSIGYSIDFSPNLEYEKHDLICEWEHCIERMPLIKNRTKLSCPVFGHNCPGGLEKVSVCDKHIGDIPKSRFVK